MNQAVNKVAILGAGSWGTAFAKVVADSALENLTGVQVVLWGRNSETMHRCAQTQMNDKYFPGIELPKNLEFSADLEATVTNADIVVLAIPAQSLREQLKQCADKLAESAIVVSLAKGLEQGTRLRMSEVIIEVMAQTHPDRATEDIAERLAVLSGPNLAKEIVAEQPTASVIAAPNEDVARRVAEHCACSYFRPYTGTDVVGVEIGGLAKNVIALCVGMCEGMGYGDNSKASVMTRGLAEITRLAVALGGEPATMSGLAGMGDLVATCSSPLSRNHTAGKLLAQGVKPAELPSVMTQTAESVKTAPVVAELAQHLQVEMPISNAVVAVLSGALDISELAPQLLGRSLKNENSTPLN